MNQIQTQLYASNIQSAEQKYAQAAYSLKMKISKAKSVMKQKISKWTSRHSSRSHLLAGSLTIKEVRVRNLAKYGSINANSRLLLSI